MQSILYFSLKKQKGKKAGHSWRLQARYVISGVRESKGGPDGGSGGAERAGTTGSTEQVRSSRSPDHASQEPDLAGSRDFYWRSQGVPGGRNAAAVLPGTRPGPLRWSMRSLTRPSGPCAPKLVGLCAPSSQCAAGPSPEAGRGAGSALWARRLCAAGTRSPASCSPVRLEITL